MNFRRVLRHLFMPPWRARLVFPQRTLHTIEKAVREVEATHAGEIRFAVEGTLSLFPLIRGESARERALDVFSQLRVWDTEQNNGVLIYLLYADRDVEIIADRGVNIRAGNEAWEKICREMEAFFRKGDFEQGMLHGIREVAEQLAKHYPAQTKDKNEIDDRPVVL
ncbi:MAG: TPM domain-containing protein [Gallionella sp.]|nr:TPM domain-containing protein [Gallionella sp.]